MRETTEAQTQHPNPYAIFSETGPFNPSFTREAVRTLFRTLPLDPAEPKPYSDRRMHAALLALSALRPRDEIDVMLGVQALSAYHAAAACFRIGMNSRNPKGDSTRHISTACNAARTFDTLLKALERRQAKPQPPAPAHVERIWTHAPHPSEIIDSLADAVRADLAPPQSDLPPAPKVVWTQQDLAIAEAHMAKRKRDKENEGLDIANTEGILPCGGMILPENPTPQQEAYMGRRLALMYRREYEEGLKKGIKTMPKIRPIRTGDLIP
jgi:hypothetical protein